MILGLIELNKGVNRSNGAVTDKMFWGSDAQWSNVENGVSLSAGDFSNEGESRYAVACQGALDSRDGLPGLSSELGDIAFVDELLNRYGVVDALSHLSGPFALAVWDKREKVLTIALDRIGQESFYYAEFDGCFIFSSDLSRLGKYPRLKDEIDFAALGLYYRHNYIPAPHSIYKNVKKLMPGSYIQIRPFEDANIAEKFYWNPVERFESAVANRFQGSFADAVDELDALLTDSIRRRIAGRPSIGAFLSGGVDSSLISAIAQKVSGGKLQTFSVGFDESDFNEAGYAQQVAEHIGSKHRELRVTPDMAIDLIGKLPAIYPEPFADSSQVPTTLISCYARQFTDVVLSGDGGDEVFGGYRNYPVTERLWKKFGEKPLWARQIAGAFCWVVSKLPIVGRRNMLRGAKLAEILRQQDPESIFRIIVTLAEPDPAILRASEAPSILTNRARWAKTGDLKERLMFLDFGMYLPDDGIVKVREAVRHVGLLALSPILDHRIVEFAWSLPIEYKIAGENGKVVLKELLYRYVPKSIVDRPKRGFAMPLPLWLDTRLGSWTRDLWAKSEGRVEDLLGKGYLTSLKDHYDRINIESRWGILRLLQWLNHA